MFWGKIAIINLYECNSKVIRNKKDIRKFIIELCKQIDMKREGELLIKRFGEGDLEGYSAVQFIQTSSITLHFDEAKNRAFIDIFSCKNFDGKKAENFSREFFNARNSKIKTIIRK